MLDFQQYQLTFTAHIRDPKSHKKPANVVEERMAVYREAVFNNIFEAVSVCFPVCQLALGKRAWRQLIRQFVVEFQASSPIFRDIPKQFLDFLKTVQNAPLYLASLAHYEWVELAVSAMETKPPKTSKVADLTNEKPILAPASMLLEYDFPVHKISARFKPKGVEKTYLLVFRNNHFEVKFIELNPVTYQLLHLIHSEKITGKQALTSLANNIRHADTDAIIQFGMGILADLVAQQAIIGSAKIR